MNKLKYFMTSNLGGGGQTVSRFPKHLGFFNDGSFQNIGILLNYHYLTFYEKEGPRKTNRMVFDKKHLETLNNTKINFNDFFNLYKEETLSDTNITNEQLGYDILLDTGSGKILADSILHYDLSRQECIDLIFKLVEHHLEFSIQKKAKYVIAMDFCKKNTYKNKEGRSENYKNIINTILKDNKLQNDLLLLSLEKIKGNRDIKLFAPLHGNSVEDYLNHHQSIVSLENKSSMRFSGFAIGGLGRTKLIDICKIVKEIRDLGEDRDIHILGSSGLNKLLPLCYSGANFFDCHTPWRRANDNENKFSIPLLNKKQEPISTERTFKNIDFVDLQTTENNCDCKVCENFKYEDISKMLLNRNNNSEDYYFAKILIYFHAVYQYSFALKKLESLSSKQEYWDFFKTIKDINYREGLMKIIESID